MDIGQGVSASATQDEALTPYDQCRAPRAVDMVRGKKLVIAVESIKGDFQCPICLSIMTHTAMIPECLHRFCKKCIEQSIRNGYDCPTCRVKMKRTRRTLKNDTWFDNMISTIFGNADEFERREEEAKANAEHLLLNSAKQKSIEIANSMERSLPSTTISKSESHAADSSPSKQRKKQPAPVGLTGEDMLFVLRKHPMERLPAATSKEYIKASQRLTIAHICEFLVQRYRMLAHPSTKSIQPETLRVVYHDQNGEEHILHDDDSLKDLVLKFKQGNRVADLILHYKVVSH